MTEAEIFQEAYTICIKNLYATFSVSIIAADDNEAKQSEAETHFRNGLINAKKLKGRALTILAGL